jgi:ATP-binding cassette subfamily B protein
VLAAGSRLSAYIGATAGEFGFVRGFWMGSRRLAWLEDYAASLVASADLPASARLTQGIRFEHVSFAYPGADRLVPDDVNLELPAGAVVAIVGENGAGKTTMVKLVAKLYEPTSGRILVDGAELGRMHADYWRSRLAGAFQDFFRFEFRARHTVGVGDVPRLDDAPAVVTAVARAFLSSCQNRPAVSLGVVVEGSASHDDRQLLVRHQRAVIRAATEHVGPGLVERHMHLRLPVLRQR